MAVNWWCKILLDAHSLHWNRSGFIYLFLEFRKRVTIEIGVVVKFKVSPYIRVTNLHLFSIFFKNTDSPFLLEVDLVSWIFDDRGADLQFFLASTWWGARCLPFQTRLLFWNNDLMSKEAILRWVVGFFGWNGSVDRRVRYRFLHLYVGIYLGEVILGVVSENMEELLCGRLCSIVMWRYTVYDCDGYGGGDMGNWLDGVVVG